MENTNPLTNRLPSKLLPKHGPAWTFYAFTALAVALVAALVVGFEIASRAHWF